MDQHEPGNNLHISVDKPPKLNVYKMFLWRLGRLCPLRYRNISKLMNDLNVHFHFKSNTKENQ